MYGCFLMSFNIDYGSWLENLFNTYGSINQKLHINILLVWAFIIFNND